MELLWKITYTVGNKAYAVHLLTDNHFVDEARSRTHKSKLRDVKRPIATQKWNSRKIEKV